MAGTKHTWDYNDGGLLLAGGSGHLITDDGAYLRYSQVGSAVYYDAKGLYDNGHLAGTLIPNINAIRALGGGWPAYRVGLRVIYDHPGRNGQPSGYTFLPISGGHTFIDWNNKANVDQFIREEQDLFTSLSAIIDFKDALIPYGISGEPNWSWDPALLSYMSARYGGGNDGYSEIIRASNELYAIQYGIWGKKLIGNIGGTSIVHDHVLPAAAALGIRGWRQDSFGREDIGQYYNALVNIGTTFTGSGSTLAVNVASYDFLMLEVTGGGSACGTGSESFAAQGYDYDTYFAAGGNVERLKATAIGDMGPNLGGNPGCVAVFNAAAAGMLTTFWAYGAPGPNPINRYTFTFTDTSTVSRPIVSWLWDFDDGSFSTEQSPVHQFAFAGSYNVTVTVVDDLGNRYTSAPGVANTAACPF